MGDVKAAAGLGTRLAQRGRAVLLAGGFAGFLLAAVYRVAFLMSGRATRKHQIPFGPFVIVRSSCSLPGTLPVPSSRGMFSIAMAYWAVCRPVRRASAGTGRYVHAVLVSMPRCLQ